jgi:hypothetical protein
MSYAVGWGEQWPRHLYDQVPGKGDYACRKSSGLARVAFPTWDVRVVGQGAAGVIPFTVREAPQGSTWGAEVLQLPGLELLRESLLPS